MANTYPDSDSRCRVEKEVLSEKGKEIGKIILIWGMIFALGGCGNIIGYHDISWRNFLRFSEARSQLFDYYGTPDYSEAKDILKEYNVSKNEYEAFCNYNILNWEVGTECVEKLVSFQKEKIKGKIILWPLFANLLQKWDQKVYKK